MKRLLMLKPTECASGDTKEGKIYEIIEDQWLDFNKEKEEYDVYTYSKETVAKYPDGFRHVTIKDESSEDSFEVDEDEDRLIIFENDKELAHALIDRIKGLDKTIVNMASAFMKA